eukprot:NODE_202_length_14999_cov_0.270067.p11 type:complete len:123 gc:universal NODE_202_length_14999_cov_0.270067:3092-3460(+)
MEPKDANGSLLQKVRFMVAPMTNAFVKVSPMMKIAMKEDLHQSIADLEQPHQLPHLSRHHQLPHLSRHHQLSHLSRHHQLSHIRVTKSQSRSRIQTNANRNILGPNKYLHHQIHNTSVTNVM